jgi:hypothetical protein
MRGDNRLDPIRFMRRLLEIGTRSGPGRVQAVIAFIDNASINARSNDDSSFDTEAARGKQLFEYFAPAAFSTFLSNFYYSSMPRTYYHRDGHCVRRRLD